MQAVIETASDAVRFDHVAETSDSGPSTVTVPSPSDARGQAANENATVSNNAVADDFQPCCSFPELMPIPKCHRPVSKRPRVKPPSYELTSESHFTFIGKAGGKVAKASKCPRKKSVKKQKTQSKAGAHKKSSKAGKKSAPKEIWKCHPCAFVFGSADDPKCTDDWFSCSGCGQKYHESCAEDDGVVDDDSVHLQTLS